LRQHKPPAASYRDMDIPQLKKLKAQLMDLEPLEQDEAAKIITAAGVAVTQNNNGMFVDMCQLPGEVVEKLHSFVVFCNDNMQMLSRERFSAPETEQGHLTLSNVLASCESRTVLEHAKLVAPSWMRPTQQTPQHKQSRAPKKAVSRRQPPLKRAEATGEGGGILDEEKTVV